LEAETFTSLNLEKGLYYNCKLTMERGSKLMHHISKISNTQAPTITHFFAADKGRYGCIWKIYIQAEDPDADMERIAVIVNQVGYGQYPTDWITLKPRFREHVMGYLQWNTFSSRAVNLPEWTQITVKISIFDKSGNESNEVVLPFTFESGIKNEYPYQLPAPFDTGNIPRIGNIMVDLYYLII
jgi:hypothetical protein